MKNRLLILIILIAISGCNFSSAQDFARSTPPLPTPTPFLTFTPSPIPTVTLSPAPTLTPTFPPYTGEPFSIVFVRDRNLWIANIKEKVTELQLTFEPQEMRIISYDISPDGTRIVYIPYQLEPLNSLIKLVEISTGETRVILGENDPFSEVHVVWLGNTKIAYKNQDHLASSFVTQRVDNIITYIIYDLPTKRQLEITNFDFISPSPDKRFWLTCIGHVEGCHTFTLHNLENGQEQMTGENLKWVHFMKWSPDTKFMLFDTVDSPDDCTGQLVLINTETLEERMITPEDKDAGDAEISPSGESLVYRQTDVVNFNTCERGEDNYWLMNMIDFKAQKIPIDFEKSVWNVNWTPDGKRLIFFYDNYGGGREHDLWSINMDGSGLKPMLANVEEFRVLSNIP